MMRTGLALFTCIFIGAAVAKEGEPTAPASKETTHDTNKDKAKDHKASTTNKPKTTGISKKAYARLVAAELRRHTPKMSDHGGGSVSIAFTIGSSGRVVSHTVKRSTDPALTGVVQNILTSVKAPPPPGGSFSANQEFTFH